MTDRRNVLITGASSGLGAELARQLAALGHDLALCARRTDRLEELSEQIGAAHPERRVVVRPLDVTDDDQVFEVFRAFARDLGSIDRVVVNAGVGHGAPLGTGGYAQNRATAMTDFVAALAQCEAAMELFRAQGGGHLVVVSSIAAVRGMPGAAATYAASKAGLAHLAEGLRAELYGQEGYAVTVLRPGYVVSEMSGSARPSLLRAGTRRGVAAMVAAIEREVPSANVPRLPWALLAPVLRHAPLPLFRKLT